MPGHSANPNGLHETLWAPSARGGAKWQSFVMVNKLAFLMVCLSRLQPQQTAYGAAFLLIAVHRRCLLEGVFVNLFTGLLHVHLSFNFQVCSSTQAPSWPPWKQARTACATHQKFCLDCGFLMLHLQYHGRMSLVIAACILESSAVRS